MILQGRELIEGRHIYRGKYSYLIIGVDLYSAILRRESCGEVSKYREETIQESFRHNPYDIPDDPPTLPDEINIGDVLFDTVLGDVTVKNLREFGKTFYPIKAENNYYTANGYRYDEDKHPRLFKSAKEASEYFANLAEETK